MIARALADAGHVVYASMRETADRNAPQVVVASTYTRDNAVDLRTVELGTACEASIDDAVGTVLADARQDGFGGPVTSKTWRRSAPGLTGALSRGRPG